uniref:GPALPP motifs-containing protein 1 n=1 Tax=Macrostomum lignano TaxID=282301 RepID=A0A1I8IW98_9PLAT
ATWRGHQVRQWIRAALATVKDEDGDDADGEGRVGSGGGGGGGVLSDGEDMDEADINIEEMDVDAMFDDIQLPNSPRPDSARRPRHAALPPKDAWINSPTSGGRFTPLGRLDLKGSLQVVTHRSDSTVAGGEPGTGQSGRNPSQSTHRSKKIDQIREDWGFNDDRSAQVMLERAKKMKLNSDKRKRLSKMATEDLGGWPQQLRIWEAGPATEDLGGCPAAEDLEAGPALAQRIWEAAQQLRIWAGWPSNSASGRLAVGNLEMFDHLAGGSTNLCVGHIASHFFYCRED